MENFIRNKFNFFGGYLNYDEEGHGIVSHRFVARFKYNKGRKARFLTFLIKNFTVEEYFEMLEVQKMTPIAILETKGYDRFTPKQREQLERQLAFLDSKKG
jgi:hypothetical protein